MQNLQSKVTAYIEGAFKELPAEATALLLSALSLIVLIQLKYPDTHVALILAKFFALGAISTPLVFSVSIASKHAKINGRQRILFSVLASLCVAVYLFVIVPHDSLTMEHELLWSIFPVSLASFCTPFVVSAFVAPKGQAFVVCSHFIRSFFESVTLWGLCWGAAALAIAIVSSTVALFFEVHSVMKLGPQFLILITIFFVLSFLFKILNHQEKSAVPVFWQKISTLVGAPFVAAMIFLFLLYEATLLIKGELPQNMLSPLIMGCGFVGFLCTLIFQSIELTPHKGNPLLYSANRNLWLAKPTIRIARAFPFLLALLLPMAIWAVCVRINEYGFTPFRIMRVWTLVFLGVASCVGGYRWLTKKHPLSWEFPFLLAIFALLFAIGPQNARTLSIVSQTKRLRAEFAAIGLRPFVQESMPKENIRVPWDKFNEISQNLRLVVEIGGREHISALLDGDVEKCLEPYGSDSCLNHMGLFPEDFDGRHYSGVLNSDEEPFQLRTLRHQGKTSTRLGMVAPIELFRSSTEFVLDDFTMGFADNQITLKQGDVTIGVLDLDSAKLCEASDLPNHALKFEMNAETSIQAEIMLSEVETGLYTKTQECSHRILKGYLMTTKRQDSSSPQDVSQ